MSSSTSVRDILQALIASINERNLHELSSTLSALAPSLHTQLSRESLDRLIGAGLSAGIQTSQEEVLRIFLDFADAYAGESAMSYAAEMFKNHIYDVEFLRSVFLLLEEFSYIELVTEIIERSDRTSRDQYACIRIDKVFGLQSKETYQTLIDFCMEMTETTGEGSNVDVEGVDYAHPNFYVKYHLQRKLAEVSEFAPIPHFVGDYRSVEEISSRGVDLDKLTPEEKEYLNRQLSFSSTPTQDQGNDRVKRYMHIPSILPTSVELYEEAEKVPFDPMSRAEGLINIGNLDSILETITGVVNNQGVEFEDQEEALLQLRVAIMAGSNEDRHSILQGILSEEEISILYEDPRLLTLLGPTHSMYGEFFSEYDDMTSECRAFGGCRYYLCNCLEKDEFGMGDELSVQELDWFKGYCLICSKRIRVNRHAYRKPGAKGGWYGCYCSPECVRKDVFVDDINTRMLLEGFLSLLKRSQIQDCRSI